jgi:hypothetical protein
VAAQLPPGGPSGSLTCSGAVALIPTIWPTLEDVYLAVVPNGMHGLFRGYAANRSSDIRDGLSGIVEAITSNPDPGRVVEEWFPWFLRFQRDEWLELLLTNSQYLALGGDVRRRLLDAVGATTDDYGGSFVMTFETVLMAVTRLC